MSGACGGSVPVATWGFDVGDCISIQDCFWRKRLFQNLGVCMAFMNCLFHLVYPLCISSKVCHNRFFAVCSLSKMTGCSVWPECNHSEDFWFDEDLWIRAASFCPWRWGVAVNFLDFFSVRDNENRFF
jgi:hypothetical protein